MRNQSERARRLRLRMWLRLSRAAVLCCAGKLVVSPVLAEVLRRGGVPA